MMRQLGSRIEQTLVCRSLRRWIQPEIALLGIPNLHLKTIYRPRPNFAQKLFKGMFALSQGNPVMAGGWYFPALERLLRETTLKRSYDLIVIEGTWLGVYRKAIARSKAKKVLVMHNIEEEVLRRHVRVLPARPGKLLMYHDALRMRTWERDLIKQVDLVFVTSERERLTLQSLNSPPPIVVIPNGVDSDGITALGPSSTAELLFVGSMDNLPNINAVSHFVRDVLPAIRLSCPAVKFRVVGRNPGHNIRKLGELPGVEIVGEVGDLRPYYETSAICVVPLQTGGGTRLKILEAMAFGRPVVSTPIGCEGLEVLHGRHILIAQEPSDFSSTVLRLLANRRLSLHISANARKLVEERYSWKRLAEDVYQHYESICA